MYAEAFSITKLNSDFVFERKSLGMSFRLNEGTYSSPGLTKFSSSFDLSNAQQRTICFSNLYSPSYLSLISGFSSFFILERPLFEGSIGMIRYG